MAQAGPNSGGTFATDALGYIDWTNPGNAATSNNSYATAAMAPLTPSTYYLNVTNFGFAIPGGSTIDGIEVEVEKMSSHNNANRWCVDYSVNLIKGGVYSGADYADTSTHWPTADTYIAYGGAADLWSETWTAADINASDFGVAFAAAQGGTMNATASVDHVRITIYYTESTGQKASVSKQVMII